MAKQTKSERGAIAEMIFEEVGSVHVNDTLDHLVEAGETKPVSVDDGEEVHEATRVMRVPTAGQVQDYVNTSEPARLQALPAGMRVRFEASHGQAWPITKALTILGRVAAVADLVFDDDELSRHHAALSYRAGLFFIEDLDSTNGTFVNGKRVKTAQLSPGDEVRVGSQRLRLLIES